jgi:hypothetical protein
VAGSGFLTLYSSVVCCRRQRWQLHRDFSCPDECTRIETYFDIVVERVEEGCASVARFTKAQVPLPWDPAIFPRLRSETLQLGAIYMARVLTEVGAVGRKRGVCGKYACLCSSPRENNRVLNLPCVTIRPYERGAPIAS